MAEKKFKIIYIKPSDSSFVRGDQQILEKYYDVSPILLSQMKGKLLYGLNNLKLFFLLLWKSLRRNTIFICWFADYHSAVMVLAGQLTRTKTIIFIGGQEAVCYKELGKGVYRKKIRGVFVGFSLKHASLIIANHKSLIYHENYYYNAENPHVDGIKHYIKGLKTPIEIINNGINPEKFVRDYSIQKEDNLILTVGTMNQTGDFYNKGFDLFIQVAERNPQWQFILISLNSNYIQWVEDNYHFSEIPNLKVYQSFCPQDILSESYNRAKVFVQASITEGMPNTLSEAMLLECVPVGSNINGIPDAIGETGIIITKRSSEDLEQGIQRAMEMNTSSQARERVISMFSFEKREKEIIQAIDRLNSK
ncbi:MAG: glycosyltransferase family 4 protein [Paludibacteraceae bacterium]